MSDDSNNKATTATTTTTATATATAFAASPLITPERLERNLAETLRLTPLWARWFTLADEEDEPSGSVGVARLGKKHPREHFMLAVSYAILFELTRYGGSVTTSSNGKVDDPRTLFYLKITFPGAPHDNMPVARITMAAPPHVEVYATSDDPRDLRPDALGTRGAGRPTKDARDTALGHAKRYAEEYLKEDASAVAAYMANLAALFIYHDDLFGIIIDHQASAY
jgi:hypothetical protein